MIEFLKSFGAFGGISILMLNLIIILIVAYALIRWLYYRKYKSDRIKPGDIAHNLIDGTKSTVSKVISETELMLKNVVSLPSQYSPKEMAFIEQWYMEEGILQLKQADKRECRITQDGPQPGCKYVDIDNIKVNFIVRNNRTLGLETKQELRTVKLLLLNEWIK